MLLLLLFLPLLNAIILLLFGRYLGKYGSIIFSLFYLFFSMLVLFYSIFYYGIRQITYTIFIHKWIVSQNFEINFSLLFDSLSFFMIFIVFFIYALVFIYSIDYMYKDPHLIRFLAYLSLFTFFMLILVTADNLVQLFIGWEGVGLCSYLLISFWSTRIQAIKSAIKALILNRVGDCGLFLGMIVLINYTYSLDFNVLYNLIPLISEETINIFNYNIKIIDIISICFFIGVVGKSAQLGLHTWLPDAMEGPTPVSALIHAATMVTAGVFLVIRCSFIFNYSPITLILLTFIGSLTAIFAAMVGLMQNDIKKIIAYSTCSQLGYMILVCGLGNYNLAFFHLINHAFFKALLFLSAGSIIHGLSNEQDIRKMGGLLNIFPATYIAILLASLSLMGFPFLTGFYSKDIIMEYAFNYKTIFGLFAYFASIIAAIFTTMYSMRLLYFVFFTKTNSYKQYILNSHEANKIVIYIYFLLLIGTIFFGYFFQDLFIGIGTDFFGNAIEISPIKPLLINSEFLPLFIKQLPLIFTLIFSSSSIILYHKYYFFFNQYVINSFFIKQFYYFLNKKFYFDNIYNNFFAKNILIFSYNISFKLIDKHILEFFGPFGIKQGLLNMFTIINIKYNAKNIYLYFFSISFIIVIILYFILFFF